MMDIIEITVSLGRTISNGNYGSHKKEIWLKSQLTSRDQIEKSIDEHIEVLENTILQDLDQWEKNIGSKNSIENKNTPNQSQKPEKQESVNLFSSTSSPSTSNKYSNTNKEDTNQEEKKYQTCDSCGEKKAKVPYTRCYTCFKNPI